MEFKSLIKSLWTILASELLKHPQHSRAHCYHQRILYDGYGTHRQIKNSPQTSTTNSFFIQNGSKNSDNTQAHNTQSDPISNQRIEINQVRNSQAKF